MTPRRFALGLFAALAFASQAARAEPYYPSDIVADLDLMCPSTFPDCTICHLSDSGGNGTVHKPFGAALMSMFGLVRGSPSSLAQALQEAEAAGLDANGDGVPDIQALKECLDPNVYAPVAAVGDSGTVEATPPPRAASGPPIPTYGCAVAHVPGKAGGDGAALLGGVMTWGAVLAVRRARRGRWVKRASP